jgi:hypothetical protein
MSFKVLDNPGQGGHVKASVFVALAKERRGLPSTSRQGRMIA